MRVISDARTELRDNVTSRDRIDKRIAELRILLRSLVRFMPVESQRQDVLLEIANARRKAPSLVEAVSNLLAQNREPLTSAQVRESLEQSGFDLDEYSQPLGVIMTTLNRLVEQRLASRSLGKNRSVSYKWTGVPAPK